MSQEIFLRSIAGPLSADKWDDTKSAYKPVRNPRTAPFIRDVQYINPVSFCSLGGTSRWELPKIGDYVAKIEVANTWGALQPNASVNGTQICYVDYLPLAALQKAVISYGNQTIQQIEREELFLFGHRFLREEQFYHWQNMVAGGLSQAARVQKATLRQYTCMELSTLWINQIESNALMVNALSGKLAVELTFEPHQNLIQQWAPGPVAATGLPASVAGIASPGWTDATFFDNALGHGCQLRVEYIHVISTERATVGSLYRSGDGLRYLITEIQKHTGEVVAGTTAITGGTEVNFKLQNISHPVFAVFLMFRWQNDLTATYQTTPAINNSFGRNWFNVSGWWMPSGGTLPERPIFRDLYIKSNNYFLMNEGHMKHYLFGQQGRFFNNGSSAAVAIPSFSFSQVPTALGCTYGQLDFGTIDQPMVHLPFNGDATATYATINAVAVADIGSNSNLKIDLVTFTNNNVDVSQYDMSKPFN